MNARRIEGTLAGLRALDPTRGTIVRDPPAPGRGNWVGAPSLMRDEARGRFLLTYRRRRARGEPRDRGFEACVAESGDGVHFTDIWTITKGQLGTASMERFALQRGPDGRYLLYLSYEDPADGRWRIDVIAADAPDAFDPGTGERCLRRLRPRPPR